LRDSVNRAFSRGPEQAWQEVLRRAAVALAGRTVGVWEADTRGHLHLLAASAEELVPGADQLEAALRALGELPAARPPPQRWVGSRLDEQRWCIAPVRRELPRPPPGGAERRGRERMTLELAGVCIGLLGDPDRPATTSPDVESLARLALVVEQAPAILWTTNTELRVTGRSGAGIKALDILPARVVGASLLDQYAKHAVSADSIQAHRRALAGESVSYEIRGTDRRYDAHVEPLRDNAGLVVGVAGLAVDVSDRAQTLAELQPGRLDLEDFFENAAVGLYWIGADGAILRANRAGLDVVGYERDQCVGHKLREFHVDPELADDVLRRLGAGETVRNLEVRLQHRDGSIRHVLISANARLENGRFVHARCVTRDITELKQAEQAVAYFKAMVESADDAIVGKTLDGVITTWNPAAARLYGYAAEEVIGKSIALLVPPDHRDELPGVFESLRRGQHIEHYETTRVRKDSTRVEVSVSISPILDRRGHPVGATAIARDITYRRQAERQLLHGALHDAVTDLPNRASFVERVTQALTRRQRDPDYRFAVLFLDCDHFKSVNDSLGHAAGDRMLVEIAGRLRASVRPGDIVARLGGDEFTLLLEDVASPPEVEHAARRILDCLAAPFSLGGREMVATASIGAVLSDPPYEQAQDMLHDADLAMYRAKERGRARLQVFDLEMRTWAHARSGIESDLREALGRNEFGLVFQPIVELETGRVHAFEALLRWHHPKRRTLLPHEFLPLAEQTGLIIPIGAWVLREACRHARTWQSAAAGARPVRISVNLSAKQLAHPGIVEDVRAALEGAGLRPDGLSLEVTESVLMDDVEASLGLLHRLRDLSVELHMDDFGSGYSSLSALPRFPLQAIKVDRTFVHRMGMRRTDLEIVRSIVDLAERLGLAVIAEGVETTAQRERLIAFGCELGQGFLFAKALEPDAAEAVLAEEEQRGSGAPAGDAPASRPVGDSESRLSGRQQA
jgi:diguanylate cyclase (GGDEF)-like protein/PAS domain S-box-containing protein